MRSARANKNLPTFVNIGRPSSPVQLTGGYLGATVAATPFQPGDTPIPNLNPPKGSSAAERERQMQALQDLNQEFREHYAHQLRHRGPRRRPTSWPRGCSWPRRRSSISPASRSTCLDLYGIGEKETDDFGRQLLLARRLAEEGVRFIQICHAGGGNGGWDAHGDMKTHAPLCRADRQADRRPDPRPEAARHARFARWWSGPASSAAARGRRTPPAATTTREGYTVWLAGGGVKGGIVHGATDDVGYKAVEHPHYYSDLHATILHQLGLDYKKMEIHVFGRTMRLVEEGDGPIKEILA